LSFLHGCGSNTEKGKNPLSLSPSEKAIRKLPKIQIVEGHKEVHVVSGPFGHELVLLEAGTPGTGTCKTTPSAVPGAMVRQFLKNVQNPESPITPRLAEAERIQEIENPPED